MRQQRDRRGAVNSEKLLPSFDCGSAKQAAEKAICSDPDLARLDREIDAAYKAALADPNNKTAAQTAPAAARLHRRAQQVVRQSAV